MAFPIFLRDNLSKKFSYSFDLRHRLSCTMYSQLIHCLSREEMADA